jgi:hypothetical protein
MGALHVVGEDLQLRLSIHFGRITEEQVSIGLLGVGLLSFRPDKDFAIEHRAGASVEHALIDLPAATVGLVVVDGCVVVDQLLPSSEIQAVHQGLDVLLVQPHVKIVPGQGATHRHREGAIVTVTLLIDVGRPDVIRPLTLALDPGVLQPGVGPCHHLGDSIGPVGASG